MNPWSNIEISNQDFEIAEIEKYESSIDDIPATVRKIRELITRFEVCHFKYQQHLKLINDSIVDLKPIINPDTIGSNHINKGENAWVNDKTGRSLIGQQYLWVLKNWLATENKDIPSDHYDKNLDLKISKWLGVKSPDKTRLVRLLIARLTYDWGAYEKLQQGGQYKDLEYQICRMDICHYAFPNHLDNLIQAIGVMKPYEDPEGCGSYNSEIKTYIKEKFFELCSAIKEMSEPDNLQTQSKNDLIRMWLFACLAKTIKEQTGLTDSLPKLL